MVRVEMRLGLNASNVSENTQYQIIDEPRYVEFESDSKKVRKLLVPIKDINSMTEYNYYPNNTNIKLLVSELGQETSNWVDHYLKFEIIQVMFKGKQVPSISISEVQ